MNKNNHVLFVPYLKRGLQTKRASNMSAQKIPLFYTAPIRGRAADKQTFHRMHSVYTEITALYGGHG